MAFWWGKSSGPAQVLERELSPYKSMFRHYDRTKEDLTALVKQFANLTPTMHSYGGTSIIIHLQWENRATTESSLLGSLK